MPKRWDGMTIHKGRNSKPFIEWSSYAKALTIQNIMNECVDIHRRSSLQDAIEYFEYRIVNGSLELNLLQYFVKQYKKPIGWNKFDYMTPTLLCVIIKKPEVYENAYQDGLTRILNIDQSVWYTEVVKKTMRYLKLTCPNSPLVLRKESRSGERRLVFNKSLGSFDMEIENSSFEQLMVEINKIS